MELVEQRRQVRTFQRPEKTLETPAADATDDDNALAEANNDNAAETTNEETAATEMTNDE